MDRAQVPGVSAARFILSEDERTPQVQGEVCNEETKVQQS